MARKGPTNGICPMCQCVETIEHLLFDCLIASFVWLVIKEAVEWPDAPHSIMDLVSLVRYGERQNFDLIWVGAAATMWSLWTIQNKLIFEGKVLRKPTDAIYRIIFFLRSWRPLWREQMQGVFDWIIGALKIRARRLDKRRRA